MSSGRTTSARNGRGQTLPPRLTLRSGRRRYPAADRVSGAVCGDGGAFGETEPGAEGGDGGRDARFVFQRKATMEKQIYTLFSDGGARGNPGPAAGGFVLKKGSEVIAGAGEYLGATTNNVAEYTGLLRGLEEARKRGITELACFLDSKLIVEQMNRRYKVKQPHLAVLFVKVWNIATQFQKISFTHIPREQNHEADEQVNLAIDSATKK